MRGLATCRRAVAALEFTLACGPLLILLYGFIATNAVFYTWSQMQNNVQYAALMMATGQITSFSSTAVACSTNPASTTAEYYACQGLPGWTSFTVTATESCATPSVTVALSANASTAGLADIYALFSGKTLSVQSVTMKQGNCP